MSVGWLRPVQFHAEFWRCAERRRRPDSGSQQRFGSLVPAAQQPPAPRPRLPHSPTRAGVALCCFIIVLHVSTAYLSQLGLDAHRREHFYEGAAPQRCGSVVAAAHVLAAHEHLRAAQGRGGRRAAGGRWFTQGRGGLKTGRCRSHTALPRRVPLLSLLPNTNPLPSPAPARPRPPPPTCGTVRLPVRAVTASCTAAPSARSSSSTTLASTPRRLNSDLTSVQSVHRHERMGRQASRHAKGEGAGRGEAGRCMDGWVGSLALANERHAMVVAVAP